jgi:signal transduction histidine kinase
MKSNDQVIGILSVYSGKEGAFADEDRHAIDIIADHFGAALRNAFLLEELQRAGQMKNHLLMLISHELHTPLTSIKEGMNLVLDGALGPTTAEQREFLGTVNESTARLEALIEKVLIATQLLTGQIRYAMAPLDLSAVLHALQERHRSAAETKRVALEFAGLGQPLKIEGDAQRLSTALSQLLENAVHATGAGGMVTVRAAPAGSGAEVQVSDTGSGIPAEQVAGIFEQFSFTRGIDDRKTGGLGLGLFIAKGVVTGHRGTIRLESQPGQGTRVTLTLPKSQSVGSG